MTVNTKELIRRTLVVVSLAWIGWWGIVMFSSFQPGYYQMVVISLAIGVLPPVAVWWIFKGASNN